MKTILIKILAILICISLSVPGAVAFADSENAEFAVSITVSERNGVEVKDFFFQTWYCN